MQNAEQLENAYNTLKNSAGSSAKEQEAYMDSLSGKINALKETFTAISMQMINADVFKDLIDGATTGVKTISGFIDLFGAFPSVVGVGTMSLIAFNSRIRENTNFMLQAIPGYSKVTTSIKGWSDSIAENIKKLQIQKSNLKMEQEEALASGKSTAKLGKEMIGLNSNLAILKTGFIATKVAMVAFQAVSATLVTMGISMLISGLGNLIDKLVLTKSELNELNQEFVTTNSNSEMSNVIDLIKTYEELEDRLSTLSQGTSEYQAVEKSLASTQESILSIYPNASKVIENNTEAKKLNLEATKKLIDKDLELAKSDALNILDKNDTKSDVGLDKAIEEYKEYYKVLQQVNNLAEKGNTKSINIQSGLSKSGELLVNAKDVDTYKKRVESLNDTLEASYEAYKILGVSNDEYAEKAKKVGEALGYTTNQTDELINKFKETNEAAVQTKQALEDINGDGIIDATDQMLKLAETTDDAKTAIENLGDAFSQLESPIKILETAIDEFKEYGILSDDTWSDIITSGNSDLISLLGNNETFLKNAEQLYENLKNQQEELAQQTIRRAQEDVNASGRIVDSANAEISAMEDLARAKDNAESNSMKQRENIESILASNNANSYNADESNFINKENNKIRNSFLSANQRMNLEASIVDNNSGNYNTDESNFINKENYKINGAFNGANQRMKAEASVVNSNSSNYSIDSRNQANVENTKINNANAFANAAMQGVASMTTNNSTNYSIDASNFASATNSKLANIRALNDAVGSSARFFNEYRLLTAKTEEEPLYKQSLLYGNNGEKWKQAPSVGLVQSGYVGSGGVAHGNIGGSGSSGGKGSGGGKGSSSSSSSAKKEVEDIVVTADWYIQLNNAIDDNNRLLEENRNAQKHASGTNLIKLMNREVELMKQQVKAQQDLLDAKKVAANQSADYLRSKGIQIDANNNLVNTTDKLIEMKRRANKLSGDSKAAAIAEVKLVEEQIELFTELTNSVIPGLQGEIEDLNNSILDVYKDQLDLVSKTEKEIYEVIEYYAEKTKDAKIKVIDEQISALEKLYALEDKEDELANKQNNLADIKNQMDLYENSQDSIGKAKYNELKAEYDELLKELNSAIRDDQKESMLESLESQKESIEKEYEDILSPENVNKIIADAMKSGYIQLGDEVLDLNSATTKYLAETTIGTQNLISANTELLNSYLSVKDILKDISKLNTNLGNIGIDLNSVYSGISRNSARNSVSFGNITVQIQGNTNMNQIDIENAVQRAIIDVSNKLK